MVFGWSFGGVVEIYDCASFAVFLGVPFIGVVRGFFVEGQV
jgi:thioesterase domain-containing protein